MEVSNWFENCRKTSFASWKMLFYCLGEVCYNIPVFQLKLARQLSLDMKLLFYFYAVNFHQCKWKYYLQYLELFPIAISCNKDLQQTIPIINSKRFYPKPILFILYARFSIFCHWDDEQVFFAFSMKLRII